MNNILKFLYKEIPGSKGRIDHKISVSANEIGTMIVRYCEEQKSEIPIVSEHISKVDLEDFADQFIEDRYRTLDHKVWGNEMEADRKIFMEGMKRIYYAR